MTKYFKLIENTNATYEFDFKLFLSHQHEIASYFEDDCKVKNIGIVNFAKRLDDYYARINGELAEVYRELFKYEINKKELLTEIIDVMMYICSQNYIIDANMTEMDKDLRESTFKFNMDADAPSYSIKLLDRIFILFAKLHERNTQIVDLFPVEWHENIDDYTKGYSTAVAEADRLIEKNVNTICLLLLNLAKDENTLKVDYELLNEIIENKQNKIINKAKALKE